MFRTVPLYTIRSFSPYTQQWYTSYRFCWHLASKRKTLDDGQRNSPKYVEFYSKTKFEKLVHLTYLLTYSMVQSPSWEPNWFEASQEIPRILWNPKVHYRTHKRPPPVPNLGQPNPVHIPTSHLLEIHPNTKHPSTPRSPQCLFPSDFPTKTLYTPSPHPYAPHAQPIVLFSILLPAQYWVRSRDHFAPRCAISSIPPSN